VIAPYNPVVPEPVVADAEAVRTGIIDDTVHPFSGPIHDQAGALRVPEGETIDDATLAAMDWYVQGVQA
jgi:simple sugar transport system substrate-binding protein